MTDGYVLLQEKYEGDPWRILVCAILVRRCRGSTAKPVAEKFFAKYPTCLMLTMKFNFDEINEMLQPLGLQGIRTKAIRRMSDEFMYLKDHSIASIKTLPEVGEYAQDSYRIFVLGERNLRPKDLMLRYFLLHHQESSLA